MLAKYTVLWARATRSGILGIKAEMKEIPSCDTIIEKQGEMINDGHIRLSCPDNLPHATLISLSPQM